MQKYLVGALTLGFLTTALTWCHAWWIKGHEIVTEAACAGLPDEMPAFFRAGSKALAHYSGDPDRWKNKEARHLNSAEAPNHYLDMEDFEGRELPALRWDAIALLQELKKKPEKVGMLPWAILENYDRLSCAFADLRADPENPVIRAKCLVHAGDLAHLTGDCAMPLHTTRDYDGRKMGDKVEQKGIHARVDGFPEKHGITAEEVARGLKARALNDVWAHTLERLNDSHAQIERCYELDKAQAFVKPTEESRKFILERCRVGAQFTMDLWYTAWLRSAKMPKPY